MCKPTQHTLDHVKSMLLESARMQHQLDNHDQTECVANKTMDIRNLDLDINALQVSFDAIRESFETEIIRLRRLRNSLTPVESLPPEVLTTIFHLALHTYPVRDWYKALYHLSSVSSRWYRVILGTPSFWSVVHIDLTPTALATAFVRLGNHPLAIDCSEPPSLRRYPWSRTQPFFQEMSTHIARWQSVNIEGLESLLDVQSSLEAPALVMKSCCLRRGYEDDTGVHLNLFSGQAPRLEALSLDGVSISWESPILSGLSYLSLTNMGGPGAPTITQILRILSNCPHLTYIKLSLEDYVEGIETGEPSMEPVNLLSLENMIFIRLPFDFLSSIVERIHAPNCFKIRLETSSPEVIAPSLLNSCAHLFPSFHSRLSSHKDAQLTIDGITLKNGFPKPSIEATIGEENDHAVALFGLLHDQFEEVAFQEISLKFYASHPHYMADKNEVLTLYFLRSLEVDLGREDTHDFLSLLGTPTVTDEGIAHWPLPRLRELTVHTRRGHYSVLNMLESRYGRSERSPGATEVRLPDPLERLRLDRMRKSIQKAIEDVVGEGRLDVGYAYSDVSFSTNSEDGVEVPSYTTGSEGELELGGESEEGEEEGDEDENQW